MKKQQKGTNDKNCSKRVKSSDAVLVIPSFLRSARKQSAVPRLRKQHIRELSDRAFEKWRAQKMDSVNMRVVDEGSDERDSWSHVS